MARRKKKGSDTERLIFLPIALLVGGFLMQNPDVLVVPFLVVFLAVGLWLCCWVWSRSRRWARLRALRLSDVDNMPGHEFEHYVAALLKHRGFETEVTKGSGDFGVDIVARKGKLKYAIQTKRYSNAVDRKAVSDAVAAKSHYGCNAAMVVTSNRFTQGAMEFAASVGCELVDREELARWIADFQGATSQQKLDVGAAFQRPGMPFATSHRGPHAWDCGQCSTRNAPQFSHCRQCGAPMSRGSLVSSSG